MMGLGRLGAAAAASVLALGVASSVRAATTLSGTDFDFTFDESSMGLYGVPTVSGNTLHFAPPSFSVSVKDDDGVDVTNSTVNVTVVITAKATGLSIGKLSYEEGGAYTLTGELIGKLAPLVSADGQVRVTPGALQDDVTDAIVVQASFVNGTHPWLAQAEVDLSSFGLTSVLVTLENLLTAESYLTGDAASISKTFADLTVTTVPLPAALWLLGVPLGVLLTLRRRPSR